MRAYELLVAVAIAIAASPAAAQKFPVPGTYSAVVCNGQVTMSFMVTGRQGDKLIGSYSIKTRISAPSGKIGPNEYAVGTIAADKVTFDLTALFVADFSGPSSGKITWKNPPRGCPAAPAAF